MTFWSSQRLEANLARLTDHPDLHIVDCNALIYGSARKSTSRLAWNRPCRARTPGRCNLRRLRNGLTVDLML